MIAFTKVDLPFGELGNMSPHRITYEGKRYKTAEALFQALRFEDEEIREELRSLASPMAVKMRPRSIGSRWSSSLGASRTWRT